MARMLGKKPAVHDPRVKKFTDRMTVKLPPAPDNVNWYAMTPFGGIPMLLNDQLGCCVAATACHYVGLSSLYTAQHTPLAPTDAECLAIYEHSGYVPGQPQTDQGWNVLGHGGLMETWVKGITVGGKINKVAGLATVDYKNSEELRIAIALYGFVLTGAELSEDNVQSDFMWDVDNSPKAGGHEFLISGCEKVAGRYFYDIETWNGRWRATEAWVQSAVDEAIVIYDEVFFNVRGLSGGGIDKKTLHDDLAAFGR